MFAFRFTVFSRAAAALVVALVLIVFAATPHAARAQASMSLLSNLDATPLITTGTLVRISAVGNQRAVAFTTGADNFTLASVDAYLGLRSLSGTASVLSFGLYTQSMPGIDDPGTLVADLGTNTVTNQSTTPTVYTFTSSSGYVMTANTRYVLLCDYVSGDDGIWYVSDPDTAPTARNNSGYNAPVYRQSNTNGASYFNGNGTNLLSINGTVVPTDTPEPASLVLMALGVVPLAGLIARRRQKTTS